jgi:YVTN family beta-propeller protein
MKRKNTFTSSLIKRGNKFLTFISLVLTFSLLSCDKADDIKPLLNLNNGAFILNQGAWLSANASVSFYRFDDHSVTPELFKKVNGNILGDVLQDLIITDDNIFMVLNGSNYIQVVEREDFKWVETIEDLNNPRYLQVHDNSLFITQWGSGEGNGQVVVIDLESLSITSRIDVGKGPEGILIHNNLIWVANSGGYKSDNSISIINPTTLSVEKTVEVSDGPKHFVVDATNDVWVICFGSLIYDDNWSVVDETASNLVKLSGNTQELLKTIKISDTIHPSNIDINPAGSVVYTSDSRGIFAFDTTNALEEFPESPLISGSFYGFNVNPANGDIYACQVTSFTQPGKIIIHNGTNGNVKRTLEENIGIGPARIVFQ